MATGKFFLTTLVIFSSLYNLMRRSNGDFQQIDVQGYMNCELKKHLMNRDNFCVISWIKQAVTSSLVYTRSESVYRTRRNRCKQSWKRTMNSTGRYLFILLILVSNDVQWTQGQDRRQPSPVEFVLRRWRTTRPLSVVTSAMFGLTVSAWASHWRNTIDWARAKRAGFALNALYHL